MTFSKRTYDTFQKQHGRAISAYAFMKFVAFTEQENFKNVTKKHRQRLTLRAGRNFQRKNFGVPRATERMRAIPCAGESPRGHA